MLVINKNATRGAYPGELRDILSIAEARRTRAWLSRWSQLAPEPTPLWQLPDMAEELGLAGIFVKDESKRSALGSFKALGAPAALVRLILRAHPAWDPVAVLRGAHAAQLQSLVVISATDGNHGRALAAAAQSIGVRCVIVLHKHVSVEREAAIAAFGAEIVRIEGNYDASVAHAAALAQENGWQVVSDTSYAGYEDIPRDVMQGYGILADEVMEQQEGTAMFSHVILQGGVGGLAAGVASYLWEQYGEKRPTLIVVEPRQADCLLQSAINGHASNATGTVDSVMAGLACGETSPLAWRFLAPSVDAFLTIEDGDAVEAMRLLARGSAHDSPIVSGESGAAGIAALRVLTLSDDLWRKVRLDVRSKVLLISTEGATAPSVYRDLVGIDADDVLRRQRAPVRF
ncbi:diaminopropionate ammonia-lyase [Variovorax boronicumulans]|uniref:diaminopropionate ammonia-lyase n=1 Tax=Variovorax boronicumulans TaxID=436515 RepID=UPI0027829F6A|nr:diaminopropionate ammonia-lyase [Variovorax boronicumulans]MDQ0074649.1 diaminopropionate ammonia-lyase [Variovorax boronicumulans]